MSDIEQRCLQTAPSICSDADQDAPLQTGIHSLSSIDFVQRRKHCKSNMSGDPSYSGFLPGRQRPPHHQYGHSANEDDIKSPSGAPLRRDQSTNEWSLPRSESQSGLGSPRKELKDVPSFSVGAVSKPPRSESHVGIDPDHTGLSEQDLMYENTQKPKRKDKKKKSRRVNDPEDTAMEDHSQVMMPMKTDSVRRKKKRQQQETSPGTYVDANGADNPAYKHTEVTSSAPRRSEMQKAPNASRDTLNVLTAETEEEAEENSHTHVDEFQSQKHTTDTMMSQKIALHAVTLKNSAMTSEAKTACSLNDTQWFISSKILLRECCVYARNGQSLENDCQCGRDILWHKEKGVDVQFGTDKVYWHPHTHAESMPCDSFGEIHFRGFGSQSKNSPYMRVDFRTDMQKVWTVLTDCWELPKPRLLISVTGGAKRFYLRPRLKNILKQGLVNAAVSTGAWIITGGTGTGVMEFVGEAVQDHIQVSANPKENQCVALGIASWGAIANNRCLEGEGEKGLFPADYCMDDVKLEKKTKSAPLDFNHTHFLLVDNGTESKFGVEIEFRSKLEDYVSQIVETGVTEGQSVHVPSVLIVVEGGINTMKTVQESISHNIPVVVIDGSGRAADFISYAFRLTKDANDEDCTVMSPDFENIMMKRARGMFEWNKSIPEESIQKDIYASLRYLKQCLTNRRLINIFNLDKADSVKDIDRAILYALLKANKSDVSSQLALALAWNRCDIARQEIFTPENRHNWKQTELYNAMFTALVQDRADFVQLFLDNGVDLKRFLTVTTLWNLYCNCITNETDAEANLLRYLISHLKQTWAAFLLCRGMPDFKNVPDLLSWINKVIVHLLQDQSFRFYTDEKYEVCDEIPSMKWKANKKQCQPMSSRIDSHKSLNEGGHMSRRRNKLKIEETMDFDHPEHELFIWAILFNRRELTRLFWRLGQDHLGSALFASALLYRMSELADAEEEAELSKDMALHSDECESWAVSVLSECYARDKKLTHKLLVREQTHWGNLTLFKMAETFELMVFAEHSACQTKLSAIWKGRMALYTSEAKIIFCAILPILVPFIKFTVDPTKDKMEDENGFLLESEISADSNQMAHGRSPQHSNRVGPNSSPLPDTDGDGLGFVRSQTRRRPHTLASKFKKVNLFDFTTGNINIVMAIYFFYQAPVTKFFCNIFSYIIFMGLFSFTVLVKLGPVSQPDSPSLQEYLTWGWAATMICEEIRQFFIRDQHSLKYKFRSYFSNIWNRFDAAMYLLFIVSIVLRYQLSDENFVTARVTYSITVAMFYLRFMQYFYAEKNMGPKVIMIRKMLTDLMFFFFILLVFVVSFGVAYHANMFPQHPPSWSILKNVFYFPYFQMYGELFLENMKGDDVDGCTRNETIWREDPYKRCPTENAVVPTLMAVYMIFTNILLVNLLIAMFSYTFQTVQDNSTQVWRYYRLSLVSEYFDRPSLVPPIIIINHIFRLLRWIFYKNTGMGKRFNSFRWKPSPEEHNRLNLFEKSAMENHISVSKQQSRLTLDSRVLSSSRRLDTVMEELQMIKETIQTQELVRNAVGVEGSTNDGILCKERELMEPTAVPSNLSEPPVNSSEWLLKQQAMEMETLHQTMQDLVTNSTAMSLRLSQLTLLLETTVSNQEALQRRSQPRQITLGVQDVEEGSDGGTSDV